MAESQYYLSIRRHDGEEVKIRPGGTRERELIALLTERLSYITTRATVLQVVEAVIKELKRDVFA